MSGVSKSTSMDSGFNIHPIWEVPVGGVSCYQLHLLSKAASPIKMKYSSQAGRGTKFEYEKDSTDLEPAWSPSWFRNMSTHALERRLSRTRRGFHITGLVANKQKCFERKLSSSLPCFITPNQPPQFGTSLPPKTALDRQETPKCTCASARRAISSYNFCHNMGQCTGEQWKKNWKGSILPSYLGDYFIHQYKDPLLTNQYFHGN